jgi:hypothetical protein
MVFNQTGLQNYKKNRTIVSNCTIRLCYLTEYKSGMNNIYCLYCYNSLYMRMWIIINQFEVRNLKRENIFHVRIN